MIRDDLLDALAMASEWQVEADETRTDPQSEAPEDLENKRIRDDP